MGHGTNPNKLSLITRRRNREEFAERIFFCSSHIIREIFFKESGFKYFPSNIYSFVFQQFSSIISPVFGFSNQQKYSKIYLLVVLQFITRKIFSISLTYSSTFSGLYPLENCFFWILPNLAIQWFLRAFDFLIVQQPCL